MTLPRASTLPPAWRAVVAGGGPASLALALAVRRALGPAVAISVHDPSFARAAPDVRAYALSPAAVAMLSALGVWDRVAPRSEAIRRMVITDSRADDAVRPAYLTFEPDRDPLAIMVEAAVLGPALAAACRDAGVPLRADRVDGIAREGGAPLTVTVPGSAAIRADLVVLADGARSPLREAAGIGWVGGRYGQSGMVATVTHERAHAGQATQHFLPSGPFAILPLPDEDGRHRSSLVWTEREEAARALLAGPEAGRLAALRARFGRDLGAVRLETELVAHPLGFGLARRFVAERIALLGDAAHQIHPLAGQGLNLGFGDAAALAERIVDAVRLGLDPGGREPLAGYERDRRLDAVAFAGATDTLNRLFSNESLPLRVLRDLGLGLVDRAPTLKGAFTRQATGRTGRGPRLMTGEAL